MREGDRAKDIGQRRVYYVRWLFLCAFCLFTVPPLFVQRNAQCERPGSVCSVAQCICIPFHVKELKRNENKMKERDREEDRVKEMQMISSVNGD